MQRDPRYGDVVDEVKAFLEERLSSPCARASRAADAARPGDRLRQDGRAQPRAAAPPGRAAHARAPARDRHLAQELPRAAIAARAAERRTSAPGTRDAAAGGRSPRTCSRSSAARACFRRHDVGAGARARSRWRLLRWAEPMERRGSQDGRRGAAERARTSWTRTRTATTSTTIARRRPSRSRSRSPACRCTPTTASARPSARSGQRLVLDLRLDVGETDATVTDSIEDTVDYARGLPAGRADRPAALAQDARAAVQHDRRPAARRLRARGRVGEGDQARAADRADVDEVSVEVWREAEGVAGRRCSVPGMSDADRPARARLERRRAPRPPAGRRRRAAGARACACSLPPRPTTPTRSARCSTSRASSTPACVSRRRSSRWSCSTRSSAWSASSAAARRRAPRPARDRHRHPAARRARAADERMSLPHEQLLDRRFVLIPALELDFELRAARRQRASPTRSRRCRSAGGRALGRAAAAAARALSASSAGAQEADRARGLSQLASVSSVASRRRRVPGDHAQVAVAQPRDDTWRRSR